MRPPRVLCIAFLIVPALAAQYATSQMEPLNTSPVPGSTVTVYSSATHQTTAIVVPLSRGSSCPVSVRAQQASAANRMEVAGGRPKGVAQLLHLTLDNPAGGHVAKATVTVRGLLPKSRATLAPLTLGAELSDASRTVEVSFPPNSDPERADKSVSAQLWVPGLSAVNGIDLVSVIYADGSAWTANPAKSCRTPIDGIMLVGAR